MTHGLNVITVLFVCLFFLSLMIPVWEAYTWDFNYNIHYLYILSYVEWVPASIQYIFNKCKPILHETGKSVIKKVFLPGI